MLKSHHVNSVTPDVLRACCSDIYDPTIKLVNSGMFDTVLAPVHAGSTEKKLLVQDLHCDGMSPLQLATLFRMHKVMQVMLKRLYLVYASSSSPGASAAWMAASERSPYSQFQMSALHFAVTNRDATGLAILLSSLQQTEDKNEKRQKIKLSGSWPVDRYGRTPLDIARILQYGGILAMLEEVEVQSPPRKPSPAVEEAMMFVSSPRTISVALGEWFAEVPLPPSSPRTTAVPSITQPAQNVYSRRNNEKEALPSCPFNRVDLIKDKMDAEMFARDYLSLQRPVVITNAIQNWPAFERWQKDRLIAQYGQIDIDAGYIPYGEIFGTKYGRASFLEFFSYMDDSRADVEAEAARLEEKKDGRENAETGKERVDPLLSYYAQNVPVYAFDATILENELRDDFDHPAFFSPHRPSTPPTATTPPTGFTHLPKVHQFIMGPQGSGAPIHLHCDAFNGLVYGRKMWWLLPPDISFYSNEHPAPWLLDYFREQAKGGTEEMRIAAREKELERALSAGGKAGKTSSPKKMKTNRLNVKTAAAGAEEVGAKSSRTSPFLFQERSGWEVGPDDIWQCTQEAGELFYVPRFWVG